MTDRALNALFADTDRGKGLRIVVFSIPPAVIYLLVGLGVIA